MAAMGLLLSAAGVAATSASVTALDRYLAGLRTLRAEFTQTKALDQRAKGSGGGVQSCCRLDRF